MWKSYTSNYATGDGKNDFNSLSRNRNDDIDNNDSSSILSGKNTKHINEKYIIVFKCIH